MHPAGTDAVLVCYRAQLMSGGGGLDTERQRNRNGRRGRPAAGAGGALSWHNGVTMTMDEFRLWGGLAAGRQAGAQSAGPGCRAVRHPPWLHQNLHFQ